MHDDGDAARRARFDRVLLRAAAFGRGALELAEDGFEHGQAGADDAEEGFERGQEQDAAVGVLRVQVCGVADGGGHLDAVDRNGTDPTANKCVSIQVAWKSPAHCWEPIHDTHPKHAAQRHFPTRGHLQSPQDGHGQDHNHDVL